MKVIVTIIMIILVVTIPVLSCGCDKTELGVPFSIQVKPPLVVHAYSGQAYIFSVTTLSDETGKAVNITASTTDCDVTVNPKAIKPGQSSKVTVVPGDTSVGKTLTITIEGERDGLIETATAAIQMGDTGDSGEGTN
jgi:hypothetical protein